jgi:hypothetical protein
MKFKGKEGIVKEVQGALGLKADGIDGPKTWKMVWEQLVHDGKGEPEKPEPPVETIQDDYPEVFKSSPNQSGTISPSIGISFYGDTNSRTPSAAEIDSCAKKCVYLMSKFGLDESKILTHEQIAPGRKNDCSKETHELVLKRIKEL